MLHPTPPGIFSQFSSSKGAWSWRVGGGATVPWVESTTWMMVGIAASSMAHGNTFIASGTHAANESLPWQTTCHNFIGFYVHLTEKCTYWLLQLLFKVWGFQCAVTVWSSLCAAGFTFLPFGKQTSTKHKCTLFEFHWKPKVNGLLKVGETIGITVDDRMNGHFFQNDSKRYFEEFLGFDGSMNASPGSGYSTASGTIRGATMKRWLVQSYTMIPILDLWSFFSH